MIIKYIDGPTFQRCGYQNEGSSEIKFNSLKELCESEVLDGIKLIRDWSKIDCISTGNGFGMLYEDNIDGFLGGSFPGIPGRRVSSQQKRTAGWSKESGTDKPSDQQGV